MCIVVYTNLAVLMKKCMRLHKESIFIGILLSVLGIVRDEIGKVPDGTLILLDETAKVQVGNRLMPDWMLEVPDEKIRQQQLEVSGCRHSLTHTRSSPWRTASI